FGFRLTPGDPYIRDAFPLAPTFDTAGWFTANAVDMLAALGTLVDLRRTPTAPRGFYLEIGALDADVASAYRRVAGRLAPPADATLRDELLRAFAPATEAYHTIVANEAWRVHRDWAERFRSSYDPNVWQRLNRVHSITPAQTQAAQDTL